MLKPKFNPWVVLKSVLGLVSDNYYTSSLLLIKQLLYLLEALPKEWKLYLTPTGTDTVNSIHTA